MAGEDDALEAEGLSQLLRIRAEQGGGQAVGGRAGLGHHPGGRYVLGG